MVTQPRSLDPKALVTHPMSFRLHLWCLSNRTTCVESNKHPAFCLGITLRWPCADECIWILVKKRSKWDVFAKPHTQRSNMELQSKSAETRTQELDGCTWMYGSLYVVHLCLCMFRFYIPIQQRSAGWIDRKTWKPGAPQSDALSIEHQQHHLSLKEVHKGNAAARDQRHRQLLLPKVQWPIPSDKHIIMNTSSTNQQFLTPSPLVYTFVLSRHLRHTNQRSDLLIRVHSKGILGLGSVDASPKPWSGSRVPGSAVEGMRMHEVCCILSLKKIPSEFWRLLCMEKLTWGIQFVTMPYAHRTSRRWLHAFAFSFANPSPEFDEAYHSEWTERCSKYIRSWLATFCHHKAPCLPYQNQSPRRGFCSLDATTT